MAKYVSTNRIVKEIVSLGAKGLSPDTAWGDTLPKKKFSLVWADSTMKFWVLVFAG